MAYERDQAEEPGAHTNTLSEREAVSVTQVAPGLPTEQMQIEEPHDENIVYPTGPPLYLNLISVMLVCFLHGLDLTIVSVVVPSLTNQFNTLEDIGWYSAIYGLIFSALNFFAAKMYTLFDLKYMYIASVGIFELGSILCTFAPTSKAFIFGRALAGVGAAGQGAGCMVFIPKNFPVHKRPMVTGIIGASQALGLVTAPVIGGALIDAFTWRACFGINVPIGIVAMALTAFCLTDPAPNPDIQLPLKEKLKRLDPIGTLLIVPSIVSLMLALQWGGIRYGWGDWRIIVLFIFFVVLVAAFGYVQHLQQEKAVLPPRILKNRTVLAAALYAACTNGILAVTEYYIAIYFQGVKGYTATRAGVLGLPMVAGLSVSGILAAAGTTWVGYYTPFLFATSVLAPIACGLLTTIDLDDSPAKVAALLGFIGVAVGCGIQQPSVATMTVIDPKVVSIALGVVGFGGGMGSSLFVATSAALFQGRLTAEISQSAPGTNTTGLGKVGLADIRKVVGQDKLRDVLLGYNEAVVQTLYMPLALALLTIVGSVLIEVKSVKKKKE